NLAIVKSSDVVVCLFRADADSKPGGTQHLLELAKKRGRPALEIRVALVEGKLRFTETWHNLDGYRPPQLPAELANLPGSGSGDPTQLPSAEEYCAALKTFSSDEARGWKQWFRYAALVIIFTHILATILATVVLAFHASHTPAHPVPAGEPQ